MRVFTLPGHRCRHPSPNDKGFPFPEKPSHLSQMIYLRSWMLRLHQRGTVGPRISGFELHGGVSYWVLYETKDLNVWELMGVLYKRNFRVVNPFACSAIILNSFRLWFVQHTHHLVCVYICMYFWHGDSYVSLSYILSSAVRYSFLNINLWYIPKLNNYQIQVQDLSRN